ncbi:MAG: twin-arginine translocase subunit TatC [Actinomycetota bacterium]|nr:twin-arginine translocase subunit TatC [Actinomycetota bacterium]
MSEASDLGRRRSRWRRRRARRETQATMTMLEHLTELRRRLVVSLAAFFVISAVAFAFYEELLAFIREPFCGLPEELQGPQGCQLVFVRVLGGFLFRLKLTALAGVMFAAPVWLYQIWAFVTPGLTAREKKYAIPFVLSSVTFFVIGAAVAYWTLPTGIRILVTIGGGGLVPLLGAEEYLNFVGVMFLGFGLLFEIPLVLFFLGLAGVITVDTLRRQRKAAVVGLVALAAVVTPSQDPYTLLVLSVPLYALYELTIWLLHLVERRRARNQSV